MAHLRLPYVLRRPDAGGFYFSRKIPRDLQHLFPGTHWRWKLADTIAEARVRLPAFIEKTDRIIAELRGTSHPSAKLLASQSPKQPIPRDLDRQLLYGQPASDIFNDPSFYGSPEDAERLSQLPSISGGSPTAPQDLIELGRRLKRPSDQTVTAWTQALGSFTSFLGHDQLHLVTKQDAQSFRDSLLTSRSGDKPPLKVSTIKTRLNYLSGLFALAVEEGVLNDNPFQGVGKRLTAETTHKDTDVSASRLRLASADALITSKLPAIQQDAYLLLRYTGCRLAEVLGLRTIDIDLENNLLHIRPHELRPLKTKESRRDVFIHPKIRGVLQRLVEDSAVPFREFYNERTKRWGGGLVWSRLVGCNPHALRHHAVTSMRAAGISETVIGRTVGHAVPGMTAQYGSVDPELIKQAILSIT